MTDLPEPPNLDEHTLSHVLSGIGEQEASDGRRMTDGEIRAELMDLGYGNHQIEQVVDAHKSKCTACGERATHLYGALSPDGSISSMEGHNRLSLSCDGCADPEASLPSLDGSALVRAPLDFQWRPPYLDAGEDRMEMARLVKRYVDRVTSSTDYREDSILINLQNDVRSMT